MKKFKLKAKVLLLTMAVGLLSASNLLAQEQNGRPGGLFGTPVSTTSNGLMDRSGSSADGFFTGQTFGFGTTGSNLTGQTFGAPLGSGLLVMLMAGAGYATIKSRKKQNRKEQGK